MEESQKFDAQVKADVAVRVLSLAADERSKLSPEVIEAANAYLKTYFG